LMNGQLRVYSIFKSIQGESTRAGLACAFIRLAGCPLSCIYCDTRDACEAKGRLVEIDHLISAVHNLGVRLVEVTGGEPLAQSGTKHLLLALLARGFEVMLETSGAFSIKLIDERVRIILDMKCPGSGMSDRMCLENLTYLVKGRHELKFVICSREDFEWAENLCLEMNLFRRADILVAPAVGFMTLINLADWVLNSKLPFRLQPQLHRFIWPDGKEEGDQYDGP